MLSFYSLHRFRDASEEIRALVTDGVGNWTFLYPPEYLKDLHLKYLGWGLSDQVSPTHPLAAPQVKNGPSLSPGRSCGYIKHPPTPPLRIASHPTPTDYIVVQL